MDWKRLLNPWAALREAEITNAVLLDRLECAEARAENAEAMAFNRAAEHYYQRSRMAEQQLQHYQQVAASMVSLTAQPIIIKGGE